MELRKGTHGAARAAVAVTLAAGLMPTAALADEGAGEEAAPLAQEADQANVASADLSAGAQASSVGPDAARAEQGDSVASELASGVVSADGEAADGAQTASAEARAGASDAPSAPRAYAVDAQAAPAALATEGVVPLATSGTCGANASWSLSGGTLTISGTGSIDDYSYSVNDTNKPGWADSASSITSVVVEEGITHIGKQAFYGLSNMTSLSLPASLQSFGEASFMACSSLTSVNVPAGVTELPQAVFADCTRLSNVELGNVTAVRDYAFQHTAVSRFTLPASLTVLSALAFFDASLESYDVAAGNPAYVSRDGVLFSADGSKLVAYPAAAPARSYAVPAGTQTIGPSAFAYSRNIDSLDLDGVTTLGDAACQNMQALTHITIPDSVTRTSEYYNIDDSDWSKWNTGYSTFQECTALQSVKFGTGLQVTSYLMFNGCTALTTIDFGPKLQLIDALAFGDCSGLTSVELPSTVKAIRNGAFGNCYALTSFRALGLGSVKVGNAQIDGVIPFQAFLNDNALVNVELNDGVTAVNRAAFLGCRALKTVNLPASISFVHSIAFEKSVAINCADAGMEPYGQNGYRHLEHVSYTGNRSYTSAYKVLELVNEQRRAAGVPELRMDEGLLATAMKRATEQPLVFSHTRPDGSSCFDLDANMRGENVAVGQSSAEQVMDTWMNSEGHRQNILDADYTTIGVGCFVQNGVTYWVQNFGQGSATADAAKPADGLFTAHSTMATETFEEAATGSGIVWGGVDKYTYGFGFDMTPKQLASGSYATLALLVKNPGFPSTAARLDNDGSISWRSGNLEVATIDDPTSGTVSGHTRGYASITADMKWYHPSYAVPVDGGFHFSDVSLSDWYVQSGVYDYALGHGLISGYSGTDLLGPYDNVTRGQVATILWRMAGTPQVDSEPFNDVDYTQYYGDAIKWARATGVINGYADEDGVSRTFGPDDPVTREQLCVMFANYAELVAGISTETDFSALDSKPDAVVVDSWARQGMSWCIDRGLVNGVEIAGQSYLQPQGTAWRASLMSVAALFHRDVLKLG